MLKIIEMLGDLALVIVVGFLLFRMSDTNRNIKILADKVNELSSQTLKKNIVEYDARNNWSLLFTNAVTSIEIKP